MLIYKCPTKRWPGKPKNCQKVNQTVKTNTFDQTKTVKHIFKTDEKGNPLEFVREAIVTYPVVESFEDIMEIMQNRNDFLVAAFNEWLRVKAGRAANNDLLGMSGGNDELRGLMRDLKQFVAVQVDLESENEPDERRSMEEIVTSLLAKKKFAPLKAVVDAQKGEKITLSYVGTENVKGAELPILRPKVEGVADSKDQGSDETVDAPAAPASSRGRKPRGPQND